MADNNFWKGAAFGTAFTVAVAAGGYAGYKYAQVPADGTVLSDSARVQKLEYLEELIDTYYLEDKDEDELAEGLYAGLIYGLGDPYSRYYTAKEYQEENTSSQGSYVGIGVVMQENKEGGVQIVQCYEGGPGEAAGLKEGDVVSAVDGQDITELSIDERAKAGIGFAFQQPPRFKGMTVRRLLSLAAGKVLDEKTCCELLSSVGLCAREYIDREADATLSGGEMKRIEIATVLAKRHALCIFDEPEAGIDLWSFSMLIKRFEQIHKEKKESLILISHQERIIQMADRIMVISEGKLESIGAAEEIMPSLFGKELDSCECRRQKGGDLYGA